MFRFTTILHRGLARLVYLVTENPRVCLAWSIPGFRVWAQDRDLYPEALKRQAPTLMDAVSSIASLEFFSKT